MLNPLERHAVVERFLNNQTDEEWVRLRNELVEDMPPRVIVSIQGGAYQGATATAEVDLAILDYDNWKDAHCSDEEKAHYAELEEELTRLQETPGACLY